MTQDPKRYTITAALPYTNGPIHIGHLAGVYVPADIYARYQRMQGKDVAFICGSDEHGVPITLKAKNEGVTPQDIVDRYHQIIKDSFDEFGISFDTYSRTTSETHKNRSQEFFKKLEAKGSFIKQEVEQYFDPEANQFLADRYIMGECPKCSNPDAYGDQCEKCGTSLSPLELISPRSTLSGSALELKKTAHWYLPLDRHEAWLKEWIVEGKKNSWKSNVYGQCKSWLDDGLRPRAVTRDLDWGVPVPHPDGLGKVLYVWFDAPIGYISFTEEWAKEQHKNWEDYWKKDDTKLVHFIGKDNIVFHCIIFPTMLKEEGSYILPDNVPANEFMNLEGDKISTSRNWAVWLNEYLRDFPDTQDALRYSLIMNAPETKDNEFTWKDFQSRNNNELLAVLGNFFQRVTVLTHKYYNGKVPNVTVENTDAIHLAKQIEEYKAKLFSSLEQYKFREACNYYMDIARLGNKYLTDYEPWKLVKENPEQVKMVLYNMIQLSAHLTVLAEPFLPFAASKMKQILNINPSLSDATQFELMLSEHQIVETFHLFSKIEDKDIQPQIDKLEQIKLEASSTVQEVLEDSDFESFMKNDIRVVEILEAENVKKSKKLLKFKVDTGIEQRQILSGIAQYYAPEELVGKKVAAILNLPPRKIMSRESHGMILSSETPTGELHVVEIDKNVPNGSRIG